MNNYFITQYPYAINIRKNSGIVNFINKGLRYLKTGYQVGPLDHTLDMNTLEQRINYFLLLDALLAHDIPGEVVELGTFTGQCAILFGKVLQQHRSARQLHVYDTFGLSFSFKGNVEEELKQNFKRAGLPLPVIHKGLFERTLNSELPDQIAFAHIDCGWGGDQDAHQKIVKYCLEQLYPRLSKGAVCVLMDYNDHTQLGRTFDVNPGVKLAADAFFADKTEKVTGLYGNQNQHAYFRKS